MRSISQFYLQGRREALDPWNGGEGQRPSLRGSCRGKVRARVRGGGRVAVGEGGVVVVAAWQVAQRRRRTDRLGGTAL